jgi:acetyl-CoA acyltransferase
MKALISAYARSPQHAARKGALNQIRPDDLAAQVASGLLQRDSVGGSVTDRNK